MFQIITGVKDFFPIVLGGVDGPGLLLEMGYPFLRKRGPQGGSKNIFQVFRLNSGGNLTKASKLSQFQLVFRVTTVLSR
jgi:hypothetical protein